mmetsp:Transcript_5486/g.4671  ORF Transcript_5486/g.4671 Transcript_5486/m.4671 type:complete len:208 (-) Transcript_5486:993-1616(-)
MEKRFMDEFVLLQEIKIEGIEDVTVIEKFKHLFISNGLELDDPRIIDMMGVINNLERERVDITFEIFKALIRPCYTFFRNILQGKLAIPDYQEAYEKTNILFEKLKERDFGGFIPTYIPHLTKVDKNGFAVSICTVNGQIMNFGDVDNYICMQHITSVVSYLNALEQHGRKKVSKKIGTEPSGKPFNSLELKNNIPHNPLISSGILT